TIWLSACSRVPETPRLREAPQSNADALFIGSRLTAEDLKAIFRLLNEEGKFDGLRPLFDSPTAAELDDMAGLVSRYLYKEVDLESGLPELIRARAARSGFTALATDVDAWLKRPGSDAVIDLIVRVLDDAS